MSIDCKAFLGLGWKINKENIDYCEKQNIEWEEYGEYILYVIDDSSNKPPYFLGINITEVYEGELVEINDNILKYIGDECIEELTKIAKNSFGIKSPPKFCLVSQYFE